MTTEASNPVPAADTAEITKTARLLELFALAKLHDNFGKTPGYKEDIVREIAVSRTRAEIVEFARRYHPTTKHFLHIYSHGSGFSSAALPDDPLMSGGPEQLNVASSSAEWFYLADLRYNVFLRKPMEEVELEFVWPIAVELTRELLTVRLTKMEKNIPARLPSDRIVKVSQDLSDTTMLTQIVGNMGLKQIRPADLNKGVKQLWEEGVIDAPSVQFKKTKAMTRQDMDTEFLVRRDDPELYEEIIDKPIFSAVFRWMADPIGLAYFRVQPTEGVLGFGTYSDLGEGATRVVREILSRN